MVDLDDQHHIDRAGGQVELVQVHDPVLDIRQPSLGNPRLPLILAPFLEGRIVQQQHLSLRAHHMARQLAVVTVPRQEVDDPHARLQTRQTQHVGGMVQSIPLDVAGASALVSNGVVVNICVHQRHCGDEREQQNNSTGIPSDPRDHGTLLMNISRSAPTVSTVEPSCSTGER